MNAPGQTCVPVAGACRWRQREAPHGLRRPAPGRAHAPSPRSHSRPAGLLVRSRLLDCHPGDRRGATPVRGAGAPSAQMCGCEPWPRSLTMSARPGRPASSTEPRSVSAARPSAARLGQVSLRQEQAERREGHGLHRRGRAAAVLQSDQTPKLRGHHARPRVGAGRAPGRGSSGRDARRCQLPRTRSTDRRTRRDTAAPQVQEERRGLVRGNARASVGARPTPRAASGPSTAPPT